jgi:hypothetical protein
MIDKAADSYGGVLVSGGGRVLLREPTGHFDGYVWTFAKGRPGPGEYPSETALRAVREDTVYEARIIKSIPGNFGGDTGNSTYYLMEAKHSPEKPSWKTMHIRWVGFAEARELISQTKTSVGLERDLSILVVAENTLDQISYLERPAVQPEDWQRLKKMPKLQTRLLINCSFDQTAMTAICRGFFPATMDDKWFAFFTGERLRLHRSWSGFLVYDVGFSFDEHGGARAIDVVVNRDPGQYSNTDDDEDQETLFSIIDEYLVHGSDRPREDGWANALKNNL